MTKKVSHRTAFVVFVTVVTVVLAIIIATFNVVAEKTHRQEDSQLILQSEADKIQYSIDSRLLCLTTLEMLIIENDGYIEDFDRVAKALYDEDPCIRCIQLAPKGLINHVYPLKGNENAFGNLFENPLRRDEAIRARDTGEMTLAGPFELHQGGMGVVARRPIFLQSENDEKNIEDFWGFSIVVMDLPKLLNVSQLNALSESGYSYKVWREVDGVEDRIAGDKSMPSDSIKSTIRLPGTEWYLSIVPSEGWLPPSYVAMVSIVFLLISVLVPLLTHYIITLLYTKEKLSGMVNIDQLTGLFNARHFHETLKELEENDATFAVFYLDLNRFKPINDKYGHSAGDNVLQEIGNRITQAIGKEDEAYRIGGDEFAVISQTNDRNAVKQLRRKLVHAVNKPFIIGDDSIEISISCGYAIFPDDASNVVHLLQFADCKMYEEKIGNSRDENHSVRRRFFERIEAEIQRRKEQDPTLKFYFTHLDFAGFKYINYHYGIAAGDNLVKATTNFIKTFDECVLCGQGSADQIYFVTAEPASVTPDDIIEKIKVVIVDFLNEQQKLYPLVNLSLWSGFSLIGEDGLVHAAGRANIGRNIAKSKNIRHAVYVDKEMVNGFVAKHSTEQIVISVLKNDTVEYYLQPQYDAKTQKIVSAEALARVFTSDGKEISPSVFVPILEEDRNVILLDFAILEKVCRDLRENIDKGKAVVPVSVNMSRLHFDDLQTKDKIKEIIDKYEIPPKLICIEITESISVRNDEKITQYVSELHKIGVSVSIDDFGTGYSGFNILKDACVDELKLDRSFLLGTNANSKQHHEIISSISSIAKTLNIRLVSEGVETEEQLKLVSDMGIDVIQGFYFSKPTPKDDFYNNML